MSNKILKSDSCTKYFVQTYKSSDVVGGWFRCCVSGKFRNAGGIALGWRAANESVWLESQTHDRGMVYSAELRQHRTIPALRLKHRSGGCGTASALPKCSIMSGCGTRIVLRGQKPLALCDRCPCFGSLFPPLAALTFAASSIICAFGLASTAPRSPYRHLELCGIALKINL